MTRIYITALFFAFLLPANGFAGQGASLAPAFSLTDLRGTQITLQQYRGKVLFLAFWAPWCMPCREELPELERLYKKYYDKELVIIGISVEASASGVSSFLKKVPVTFPVVIDGTGSIAEAYQVSGLPAGFLVDRAGVVYKRYWGFEKKSLSNYETDITGLLDQK